MCPPRIESIIIVIIMINIFLRMAGTFLHDAAMCLRGVREKERGVLFVLFAFFRFVIFVFFPFVIVLLLLFCFCTFLFGGRGLHRYRKTYLARWGLRVGKERGEKHETF